MADPRRDRARRVGRKRVGGSFGDGVTLQRCPLCMLGRGRANYSARVLDERRPSQAETPDSMPGEFGARRLLRSAGIAVALLVVLALVAIFAPGLGQVRRLV